MIDILKDHEQLDSLLNFLYDNKETRYSLKSIKNEHLPNESIEIIKLWLEKIINDELIKFAPLKGVGGNDDFFIMQGNEITKNFFDSGGYTKLFNEREQPTQISDTKSTINIFKDSNISQVNQESSFLRSPININTAATPSKNPDKKSLVKKILSSPWVIAITVSVVAIAIEEITLGKIYKYILNLF